MGYIVAIVLVIVGVCRHKKRGAWYAPDVLFCYMWFAITFMSSLHLYGMYKSSCYVYFIVLVGSISYVLGVSYSYYIRVTHVKDVSPASQDFISKKIFWLLFVILFLLRLSPFIESLSLLLSGVNLQTLRNEFFEHSLSVKDVLINTLTSLFQPLLEISGVVYFVRDVKRNYLYVLSVLVLTLMSTIIDGGRFGLAFLIIELMVCYAIMCGRKDLSYLPLEKYRGKIIRYVCFLASVIVIATFLRGTELNEMLVKYYRYFCGDIVFFDQKIKIIQDQHLFPLGTGLWGFWLLFFPLLHVFGVPYPSWYLEATDKVMNTQEFFQIGDNMFTNAFSTPFYYLYADLRLVGVILGMYLFGIFSGLSYRKCLINTKNKYIIIYILVCQMIFMTIFFYPFTNTGYVLIVLYLFVLHLKRIRIR